MQLRVGYNKERKREKAGPGSGGRPKSALGLSQALINTELIYVLFLMIAKCVFMRRGLLKSKYEFYRRQFITIPVLVYMKNLFNSQKFPNKTNHNFRWF